MTEKLDDFNVELNDFARNIVDRIRLSIDTDSALGNLSEWLSTYTKLDADTYFSFKDHEMQIEIVNDINARQAIQKCSQVGASEISCRKACGITAISKGTNILYALPSSKFATKFSTSRIQPIIDTSPMLSDMRNKNAKGSDLLGLGTSFLHMGGTTGAATGAISVPAKFVFIDELDFCDLEVVGKYESRLKHAKEDEHGRKGMVCKFSTPTLPNYGINKEFKKSDQKHYNVTCSGCETEFAPDYFRDIKIPGMEKPIIDLTPDDVVSGLFNIKQAYMACPSCSKDVWDDLCNPKRRRWVAKFPDSIVSGWQIHPWDVPKVNSIPSIIMQMSEYENIADYFNFTIGIPYSDKNNSFLLDYLTCGTYSQWIEEKHEGDTGLYCIGVDVGRKSHISVGKKDRNGKLHVNYLEQFSASKEKTLGQRIVELIRKFKARCAVIDAMPDFSAAHHVAQKMPFKLILACEYTRAKAKGKMTNFIVKEEDNLVSAYRTGVLNDLLKLNNSGNILYPNKDLSMTVKKEIDEIKLNFSNTKKVTKVDGDGNNFEVFIKTGKGGDHYAHSLSYLNIACNAIEDHLSSDEHVPIPATISSFKTQGHLTQDYAHISSGVIR